VIPLDRVRAMLAAPYVPCCDDRECAERQAERDVHDLAAQVIALADALRAAEARAVVAVAERDAAVTGHAALAAAVDAVRVASVPVAEASARYRAAWDAVDGTPTIPQSEAIAAALRVSYEAQETLDAALTALLRGAPSGYVAAAKVRAYLDALDVAVSPALLGAALDRERVARTALEAALAAATTPKESP